MHQSIPSAPRVIIYAVAIWPVTGQSFQTTKWLAVLYSQQISQNRKILANLLETIICRFRKSVVFGLCWAQRTKPCFVTLTSFSSLSAGQGFQNTKWPVVLYSQ